MDAGAGARPEPVRALRLRKVVISMNDEEMGRVQAAARRAGHRCVATFVRQVLVASGAL